MRARKSSGRCSGATSCSHRSFGLTLATTRFAFDDLAVRELDARRASGLHHHASDGCARAHHHPARRAFRGHRLRDRAHAADRVSPLPRLAVHLAEDVMQQHVCRSRRVGAREVADDGVEAESGLDRRRREPAIEEVARAFREEVEQVAPLRQRELAKCPSRSSRDRPASRHPACRRRPRSAASSRAARAARPPRGRASRSTRAAPRRRRARIAPLPPAWRRVRRRP